MTTAGPSTEKYPIVDIGVDLAYGTGMGGRGCRQRIKQTGIGGTVMDGNALLGMMKIVGIFFLMMLIGLWRGCTDLHYMTSSKDAQATVLEVKTQLVRRRRAPDREQLHVTYSFTDNKGKNCLGYSDQDIGWSPPAAGLLEVRYMPGEMETSKYSVSRLKEDGNAGGVITFFVGLIGFLGAGWYTFKQMEKMPAQSE